MLALILTVAVSPLSQELPPDVADEPPWDRLMADMRDRLMTRLDAPDTYQLLFASSDEKR